MLSSRELRLLTTYVDGECSPREAQLVGRLLRRSEEARALLAQLEDDSQTLRSLPALTVPIDLTRPILAEVKSRPPQSASMPTQVPPPHPTPDTYPGWRGVAAAAAVLFLVGLATFWVSSQDQPAPKMATSPGESLKSGGPPSNTGLARGPKGGQAKSAPDLTPAPPEKPDDMEWPSVRELEMVDPEVEVHPARPGPTVITSGVVEALQSLERVTLSLPTIHQAHELTTPHKGARLLEQLGSAKGHRLELLCRDGTRGLERLRAAMAALKVNVIIDPVAQARMKKPLLRSDYAVFVENITPDELLGLLKRVGSEDRKAGENKSAEQRFDGALVVKALGQADRRELVGLIGVDPVRSRPSSGERPAKVDITKPLSELTDKQVGDSLRGAGPARPGAARAPLTAIVVPLTGPRAWSAELKRYLDGRAPAQPDTVQALIILRQI